MELKPHNIAHDKLLLDPNNYRFHDLADYKTVTNPKRYGESGVQDRARYLLESTESFELEALKESIRTNGYVPLEQIVVEKFDKDENKSCRYLVIEGNRRVAAVRSLLKESIEGALDIPADKLESIKNLPAIEVIGSKDERKEYRQTLMAIRHIAGIREWGPYQQAKLVAELYDDEEHQFTRVAQRIGISAREVGRRYRASKALQQMEDDEEFGEYATPRLYSFFHEAVSQPKVRQWLGFSDDTFLAENDESRRAFYELLSPRQLEGEMLPPKLQNANRQVRQLKDIVDKVAPLKILLDPERPFEEAVRAADTETLQDETGVLERSLALALQSLREPSIDAWLNPTERARQLWSDLAGLIDKMRTITIWKTNDTESDAR